MAKQPCGEIRLDRSDVRNFQRAVRQSTDRELPKRLGQANKSVGQLVISRLQPRPDPAATGTGRGAAVRPSADRRRVLLRVGGGHRAGRAEDGGFKSPRMQWGRQTGGLAVQRRGPRPHIRQTVEDNRKDIEEAWIDATLAALSGAFASTDKK